MITYLIINSFINFCSITYFNSIYVLKIIGLFLLIILIFTFWVMFLKDIFFKLHKDFFTFPKERFNNLEDGEFIMLSLVYKINSLKITIFKISIYFLLTFFLIFSLRFLKLGSELNLVSFFTKLSQFPFFIKLLMFLLGCLYLYIFKSFWVLFTQQLCFELKKIHIYLHQFDNAMLSKNLKKLCHFYYIFLKKLDKIFSYISFGSLFSDEKYSEESIQRYYSTYKLMEKNLLYVDKKIIPLYYFFYMSHYRNTILARSLLFFMKQIYFNFWLILKIMPLFIIILIFIIEYIHNDGIIRVLYYVIFISFIYKTFIDLLYFYKHTDSTLRTRFISICYYYYIEETFKIWGFIKNRDIFIDYQVHTNFRDEKFTELYVLSGLNHVNMIAMYYRDDPRNVNKASITILWERIKNLKVITQIRLKIEKINSLIYPD